MNKTLGIALAATGLLLGACKGSDGDADAGSADKAALEAAAALLAQPMGRIAAYQPYLRTPETKDAYAPKRRSDLQKAGAYVAGEIRFAASGVRQKLDPSAAATKDLIAALAEISKVCTDAVDSEAFDKCNAAVQALDATLGKVGAAATAAGVTAKIPRIAPDAITDETKKAVAPFLKALGPAAAEQAFIAKRGDEKASFGDVSAACQAVQEEVAATMAAFERADEPLRLVAVTHKLSIDSQCRQLNETEPLRNDLANCRKKAKSSECKVVCAKVRTRIEEGLPAAAFAALPQDADTICGK